MKNTLIILLCLILVGQTIPSITYAQWTVNVNSDVSFTSLSRTIDSTYQRIKSYVLDPLAYSIASIMLQQVTTSVVNWINTGFNGSPAFLTNPEAFFLDVGDQVTGQFISETGILSGLCSPFSIDIRLAIALGQSNSYNKRYTCTLGSVIQNVGNSTINGRSINGFMNGDFSQGGWPAFLTMTTQSQNNITGAYLTAQSDLLQRIGVTKEQYRQDLLQGGGFLSWQTCKEIPVAGDANFIGPVTPNTTANSVPSDFIGPVNAGAGQVRTRKVCETQTPGSVISGAINKSLGIPQDRLNLASSFNQIVNALFAQLVTQVLSGGLRNASSPGSGNLGGIATQLSQQSEASQLTDARKRLGDAVGGYYNITSQYLQLRRQAMDSITAVKNQYLGAYNCFDLKVGSTTQISNLPADKINYARNQMASINTDIAMKIGTLETTYGQKLTDANNRISSIQNLINLSNNATTTGAIQTLSSNFSLALQGGSVAQGASGAIPSFTTQLDILSAESDLQTLQTQLAPLITEASRYQQACNAFPNIVLIVR